MWPALNGPGGGATTAHIAISPSGTLAYVAGSFNASVPRTLVWVDRLGKEESLGVPERPYVYPRLSPDGSRIAVTVNDQEQDIWIWDVGRKTLRRFTIDPAEERASAWTPNGKRIAFGSHRGGEAGMWWQAADGTGTPERLAGFPFNRYGNLQPTTISPDGSHLVATTSGGPPNLWILKLNGDPQPTPLLQTGSSPRDIGQYSTERNAEISPDGHWIAYESLEAGQFDVYVRPFSGRDRRQVAGVDQRRIAAAVGAQRQGVVLHRSVRRVDGRSCRGSIFVHDWNACEDPGQFVCVVRADVRRTHVRHITRRPAIPDVEAK
jgi:serine/threonine-protein kinase